MMKYDEISRPIWVSDRFEYWPCLLICFPLTWTVSDRFENIKQCVRSLCNENNCDCFVEDIDIDSWHLAPAGWLWMKSVLLWLPNERMECLSHVLWKAISPRNEKFFCSHENFRSTWKLRPTWESEMSFRSTWVSFRLCHVSALRALTVGRNEFQTDLKLRPVWVCSGHS